MTERAQALEAALIGAGVLAQEVLASRQHVGNYLRQLAQSVLNDLSTEAVQSTPPVGSPTTEDVTAAAAIAIGQAGCSPCRSQRGAVVFSGEAGGIVIQGRGHNHLVAPFACDKSAACKASCRMNAVHAEQMALVNAGPRARGCDLLHVKIVDGQLVASGGPSCVQCSKLAVQTGIAGVWLFHESGATGFPSLRRGGGRLHSLARRGNYRALDGAAYRVEVRNRWVNTRWSSQ